MRRRQLEPSQSSAAGMPAKLNLSQLRRHAGGKEWCRQCCRAVPAAMSQVHRWHMRTRPKFVNLCLYLYRGRVAERLGQWICNLEAPSSSPALTAS